MFESVGKMVVDEDMEMSLSLRISGTSHRV